VGGQPLLDIEGPAAVQAAALAAQEVDVGRPLVHCHNLWKGTEANIDHPAKETAMADSVYRVTEVIGVSGDSWEKAAQNAVETAGKSVRDLRVAEVVRQDVTIENGKISGFRVRLGISFKYESGD
jgi:flavin-binding protein dodecin